MSKEDLLKLAQLAVPERTWATDSEGYPLSIDDAFSISYCINKKGVHQVVKFYREHGSECGFRQFAISLETIKLLALKSISLRLNTIGLGFRIVLEEVPRPDQIAQALRDMDEVYHTIWGATDKTH